MSLNPSPSSSLAQVSIRVLVFRVESRKFFLLASSLASSLHNLLFTSDQSANASANT
jgi:hypothetical protein